MTLTTYHHRDSHILYDDTRLAQPDLPILPAFGEAWLEPDAWAERGLVVGSAPGRGASQFLEIDEHQWVLRPYRRGGMVAKVSRADYLWTGLERTRGFREMRLTRALFEQGLPVPAPVATLVVRHGLSYRAALITERLANSQALAERLAEASPALLADVGATIRRFHDAGLDHVDLNARNLLVSADDKIWLIDFDRCRLRPQGAWRQRNLSRLKRSLERFSPTGARASYDLVIEGYHGAPGTPSR
ncbi:3-deoxy-D-manno-octulosonic acid kinase [Salinicola sp. MH3R3-1]|uniref:3-deoxy-D-manno-octulosonic acid kinase n=1 Tax=Salinicola sp. MH3R3-1 TaxID=1928762 RepID=UPI00094E89C9|nr:3-deoxy-D-manno-octulosonic acid kinase [Salinicola sp. MH3R3-1]OLO08669.1 3-deoxy-D-manno-octulosonic acid kinase [Salinicola sp. MH3R3-1]